MEKRSRKEEKSAPNKRSRTNPRSLLESSDVRKLLLGTLSMEDMARMQSVNKAFRDDVTEVRNKGPLAKQGYGAQHRQVVAEECVHSRLRERLFDPAPTKGCKQHFALWWPLFAETFGQNVSLGRTKKKYFGVVLMFGNRKFAWQSGSTSYTLPPSISPERNIPFPSTDLPRLLLFVAQKLSRNLPLKLTHVALVQRQLNLPMAMPRTDDEKAALLEHINVTAGKHAIDALMHIQSDVQQALDQGISLRISLDEYDENGSVSHFGWTVQ